MTLPDYHTLDAKQLRRVNLAVELLQHMREHQPVSVGMAQVIDALAEGWEPLRAEMIRQHVAQQRTQIGDIA